LDPRIMSKATELGSSEDKGIIDVVRIAFFIFGYANEKIIWVYFIFLLLSIFIYLLSFRDNPVAQVFTGSFLAAHYLILPMVFYNGQLLSVLAPRFLPVLGLIPCLHCLFFLSRQHVTKAGVLALVPQVLLLIFTLHLRSVSAWELALIAVAGVFECVRRVVAGSKLSRLNHPSVDRPSCLTFATPLIPFALILIGLLGLREYRRSYYDTRYFLGQEMVTRPFWHNILSGLAFDPKLAAHYRLKVDDLSEVRAVGTFLRENGRGAEWEAMGGVTPPLRWADCDRVAGQLLFSIFRNHPRDLLSGVFYFKPASLARDLAWLYGFRRDIPDVDLFVSPELGDAMKSQLNALQADLDLHDQRFKLWDPAALLMVFAFAVILSLQPDRRVFSDLAPFAILAAGSLIPTFVGYPAMHTIAEPAIMCAAVTYVAATLLLAKIFIYSRSLEQPHP
jgi:hypothetical protein